MKTALRSLGMLVLAAAACLLVAAQCERPPTVPVGATGGAPSTPWEGGVNTGGEALLPPPSPPSPPGDRVCQWVPSGRAARTEARMVNGEASPEGAYPWACAVETPGGRQYCDASLIRPGAALCAAHCQVQPQDVVHCGSADLKAGGERLRVAQARNNPTWAGIGTMGDVSVLMLDRSSAIEPVALVDRDVHADYPLALVGVGWGATCEGCPTTTIQQHITVPLVPWGTCDAIYGHTLTGDMLCAGDTPATPSTSDACHGDSGGPLVVQTGTRWAQVGIVSWGEGCARPGKPGVYTSVYQWRDWIWACSESAQ